MTNSEIEIRHKVKFLNLRVFDEPTFTEADNLESRDKITPNMARLRNLTYESDIFLEMKIQKYRVENGEEIEVGDPQIYDNPPIHIGKVPIMVRSEFCLLHNKSD